jgi:hypothetical protein
MLSVKLHNLKEKFYRRGGILNYGLSNRKHIFILLVLIIVSGVLYLGQVNNLATKGYKIKELEEKAYALREQNKQLEYDITNLRSTARLNEQIKVLNLVSVARVEYLKANGNSVAINR